MTFDDFKNTIQFLYDKRLLSIESINIISGYKEEFLLQYLENYITHILEELEDYNGLLQILPIFLEGISTYNCTLKYRQYLNNLYGEIQYRAKKLHKENDDKKGLAYLRICKRMLKDYIKYINTDEKEAAKDENTKFNYIWNVITDIRDIDFYSALTKRQCYFVNIADDNCNTIFYRIAMEYLDCYDEHYLRVLPIILENPNFIPEKDELDAIYNAIEKQYEYKVDNKRPLDRLKNLLNHYFSYENGEWIHKNSISTMREEMPKEPAGAPVVLDRIDTIDRVDLTHLRTFSLSVCTQAISTIHHFNTTSAFSVLKTDDGYELYYHIPDLPEFVSPDSKENDRASLLVEDVNYRNSNIYLFDRELLKTKSNFLVGYERKAITFRMKLDLKFRLKSLEVFESVIKNDKVFIGGEIPEILRAKSCRELSLLARITDNLKEPEAIYKSRALEIIEVLFDFLNRSTALEYSGLPFIYKNLIGSDNIASVMKFSRLTEYTKKVWRPKEAKQFLSIYKGSPLKITLYASMPIAYSLNGSVYGRVTNPHSSYIALENLRMLKDLVVHNLPKKQEWQERALQNAFIANSANATKLLEESEVKRLLLNKKKCGRI